MLKYVLNAGDITILENIAHEVKHVTDAESRKATECTAEKKKCVNCMYKARTYNLKINDEHDVLSSECPTFKRTIQKKKKRAR